MNKCYKLGCICYLQSFSGLTDCYLLRWRYTNIALIAWIKINPQIRVKKARLLDKCKGFLGKKDRRYVDKSVKNIDNKKKNAGYSTSIKTNKHCKDNNNYEGLPIWKRWKKPECRQIQRDIYSPKTAGCSTVELPRNIPM